MNFETIATTKTPLTELSATPFQKYKEDKIMKNLRSKNPKQFLKIRQKALIYVKDVRVMRARQRTRHAQTQLHTGTILNRSTILLVSSSIQDSNYKITHLYKYKYLFHLIPPIQLSEMYPSLYCYRHKPVGKLPRCKCNPTRNCDIQIILFLTSG